MWSCLYNVSNVRLGRFSQEAVERSRRVEFSGRPGGLHGRIPAHEVGSGSLRGSSGDTSPGGASSGDDGRIGVPAGAGTGPRGGGITSGGTSSPGRQVSAHQSWLDANRDLATAESQKAASSRDARCRPGNDVNDPDRHSD